MQFIFVGCVNGVQDVCLRVVAILHIETLCHSILTGKKISRLEKCINVEAEIFDPTRKIETIYCILLCFVWYIVLVKTDKNPPKSGVNWGFLNPAFVKFANDIFFSMSASYLLLVSLNNINFLKENLSPGSFHWI